MAATFATRGRTLGTADNVCSQDGDKTALGVIGILLPMRAMCEILLAPSFGVYHPRCPKWVRTDQTQLEHNRFALVWIATKARH
jgi:hypothetical protein